MTHDPNEHPGRGPIAWMAGNSVASNLLMVVLLIGGLIVGASIKQEVFPEFDLDFVNISVPYPGASPEEVERGVSLAVEEAIQGIDGAAEVTATSSEGGASISVEALEGADIQQLYRDIEKEVDAITSLPVDAENPKISIAARHREVISFAIYGDQKTSVLKERAEEFRARLLESPAITQVSLADVRDREIQVEVSQTTLRRYGLTLAEVAAFIRNASVDLPGGSLKTDGGELLVRMKEKRYIARDYASLPLMSLADGSRITLGEVATIRDDFVETTRYATFNGLPAVMVEVYRVGDQTPIDVAEAAKQTLASFNDSLPEGISAAMVRDLSEIFKQRGELLIKNAFIGLALVFIILALFLEIRLAFWVSLGIPISFLGAFLVLPFSDFTINIVTMFAFIVTLGIVVDDAIVVGENIYHKRQQGMGLLPAAVAGAREIAKPVVFSVLTNMVAFMPIYFVPGFLGKIFKSIPIVVMIVFAISLVESLFILPAHLGHSRREGFGGFLKPLSDAQRRFSGAFTRFVERRYGPLLSVCLRHRYVTLTTGIFILSVTGSWALSGRMGMELFPRIESDYAYANLTLPYGTPAAEVDRIAGIAVSAAKEVVAENGGEDLSRGILTRIDEEEIRIRILLTPPEVRPMSTTEVTRAWRERVGSLPGMESGLFEANRGGPGSGKGLTIELRHRDTDTLERASRQLADELAAFPNARDIDDGSSTGKMQFDLVMLPEGERMGFTAEEISRQVRNAYYGVEALRLQRGRDEIKVMVRLTGKERKTEGDLFSLILRSPEGMEVPLSEAVDMSRGRAYTTIYRRNQKRITDVTANIIPEAEAGRVAEALKDGSLADLVAATPGLTYVFQGKQADLKESVESLIQGLLMALILIYALLAVPFRSYAQPLIIMVCIPFGIIGAVMGHLIMGYSLSVMSLFGIVALAGVVVNDSLVFIDFSNRKRHEGMAVVDAVKAAGIQRFRPILLTTVTTFGGLAPMIFETSRQARFLIPMAISLGFGIVFATFITLLLVPSLYMILEDVKALVGRSEAPTDTTTEDVPRL
ncbi:efflux RND transporter permease subunit [Desulfoluna spongiiphila]|uniref:efflux RND transporter permease subunit n=1 Tax=Desulfoluna spongiiphila TaxID=419481 RepID=UPI001259048D|nr:efflux RND transporter permease subunit [Desulfoluna spongiiphila]VVS90632.1 acriflavin resistance protein [Desulfoluna spongiiphila]